MQRKKILIVDDSALLLNSLSLKLNSGGYDVVTAEDGAGAMSAVRLHKPHVVLLDLNLSPDVAHGGGVCWDGFLLLEWLRRLDEIKDTPVIIIGEGDVVKLRQRAQASGAAGVLIKPVQVEELFGLLTQVLEQAAA